MRPFGLVDSVFRLAFLFDIGGFLFYLGSVLEEMVKIQKFDVLSVNQIEASLVGDDAQSSQKIPSHCGCLDIACLVDKRLQKVDGLVRAAKKDQKFY